MTLAQRWQAAEFLIAVVGTVEGWWVVRILRALLLCIALWVLVLFVLNPFMVGPYDVVLIWLVGGLASGLLVVWPRSRWWLVLGTWIALVSVAYAQLDLELWIVAVTMVCDLLAVVGYALVVRAHRDESSGLGANSLWVAFGVVLAMAIRLVLPISAEILGLGEGQGLNVIVSEVALGTIVGLIAGSVSVLSFTEWRRNQSPIPPKDVLIGSSAVVLLLALVLLSPVGQLIPGAEYLMVPLLLIAAVRYPPHITALLTAIAVTMTAVASARDLGSYSHTEAMSPAEASATQIYLLAVTVSVFVLSAVVARWQAAKRDVDQSAELMTAVFLESPVPAAMVTVRDGRPHSIREANLALLDLLGLQQDAVEGLELSSILSPRSGDPDLDLTNGRDVRSRGSDGTLHLLRPTVSRMFDAASRASSGTSDDFAVLVLEDVTTDRLSEDLLKQQSRRDSLTGLPNRVALIEWLDDCLREIDDDQRIGLLLVDIDGLKTINNGLGYVAGDEVIIELARRLTGALGPTDLLVRNGGDEFAVLRPASDEHDSLDKLSDRLMHAAQEPFIVDQRPIAVSISVGSAEITESGATPTDLLRGADVALQRAKLHGRRQAARFEAGDDAAAIERMGIEDLLRRAISTSSLVCVFQPIVLTATGRVVAAETLVRLRGEDGELIPPNRFLRVAGELGLMGELTNQVLEQACDAALRWQREGHEMRVAFNAPPQWLDDDAVARIEEAIMDRGLLPSSITVEVTEDETLSAGPAAIEALVELRNIGVHVAIDDFGTGYAGLDSFRSVPADMIKLDRAFIDDMMRNPEDKVLVRSMLDLVYRFGKRAVAEGVETLEQMKALHEMGCEYSQGFYLSHPVLLEDFPVGEVLPARALRLA